MTPTAIAAAAAEGRQLLAQGHLAHRRARSRARADPQDAPADALEPERDRRDPRHQLQGPALQDQGKRTRQGLLNMTSSSFYEEGSKLLTPGAFEFVLDSELKRAVRSQNYPDARDGRSQPRMGRHDGHRRRRHGAGGGADHRPRSPRHRSARPHRQGHRSRSSCSMPTSSIRRA